MDQTVVDFAKTFRNLPVWETKDGLTKFLQQHQDRSDTLCSETMELLVDDNIAVHEDVRIGGCRILIACLPSSFEYIARLLRTFSSAHYDELHSNLLNFLDEGVADEETSEACANLAEEYALDHRTSRGDAFGTAIRYLRFKLTPSCAFPRLMRIAEHAPFDYARVFAVDYAVDLLPSLSENDRRSLRERAEWMAENDPSRRARSCASGAIDRLNRGDESPG